MIHRQQRQRRLGAPGPSAYTDPAAIYEELEAAQRVFQQGRFTVVDVTDKPIETSADEIIVVDDGSTDRVFRAPPLSELICGTTYVISYTAARIV